MEPRGLVEAQQAFLVLQNQVVCADVVAVLRPALDLRIDGMAVLVDAEVPLMHVATVCGAQPVEIAGSVIETVLDEIMHATVVLLLEHVRVLAVQRLAVIVVPAVFRHLVDEEQAQALDAPGPQMLLLVQVGEDGLADLHAAHVRLGPVVHDPALAERLAVHEPHVAGPSRLQTVGHDAVGRYAPAVAVRLQSTGGGVEVVALIEQGGCGHDLAGGGQPLVFDAGLGRLASADDDVLQVQVAVGAAHVVQLEALDLDALDQTLVVRVQRVQRVHEVMPGLVRGGVVQREQRPEQADAGLRGLATHLLRLVQDHDRPGRADHVDGAAGAETVAFREDDPRVLTAPVLLHGRVERLHVDDHHLDVGGLGELVQSGQVRRIVDEGVQFLPVSLVAVAAGRVEVVVGHVQ